MTKVSVLWTPHWYRTLFDCIKVAQQEVFLVSPWLKMAGAELIVNALLENTTGVPRTTLLTTLEDVDLVESSRISDLEAYMLLLSYGVAVRVVRGLHAKIYIFDNAQAIVTSGNLTSRGLGRTRICNLEVGLHVTSTEVVQALKAQLLPVWACANVLTPHRLKELSTRIMELNRAEDLARPAQTPTRDTLLPKNSQPIGNYWQGSSPSPTDQPLAIRLPGNDLLASLELDSDLREAFLITRAERQRTGKRARIKPPATAKPTLAGIMRQTSPQNDLTGTEALPSFLKEVIDIPPSGEAALEPDTDEVLLKELHEAFELEEVATPDKLASAQSAAGTFNSSMPHILAGPLQHFLSIASYNPTPPQQLIATLASQLSEIERQSTDAKRQFVDAVLNSPNPALGVRWLADAKALLALDLLEMAKMVEYSKDLEQWCSPYHRTLRGLQRCPGPILARWAVFLHALGVETAISRNRKLFGTAASSGYEQISTQLASALLGRLQMPEPSRSCILSLIEQHNYLERNFASKGNVVDTLTTVTQALGRFGQHWQLHLAVGRALSSPSVRDWLLGQRELIDATFLQVIKDPNRIKDDDYSPLDGKTLMRMFFQRSGPWVKHLKARLGAWAKANQTEASDPTIVEATARKFFAELDLLNNPDLVTKRSPEMPLVLLDSAFAPNLRFEQAVQWLRELAVMPYNDRRKWVGDDPERMAFCGIILSLLFKPEVLVVHASQVIRLLEEVDTIAGNVGYRELNSALSALKAADPDARTLAEWIKSRRARGRAGAKRPERLHGKPRQRETTKGYGEKKERGNN